MQAFALYHVHSVADVTEGGVAGLILLIDHQFSISPAFSGLLLNAICYLIGFRTMGKHFLFHSALSVVSFSLFYRILEQFPLLFPNLYDYPLLAALLGALLLGGGAGLVVRMGGATTGDDALALSIERLTGMKVERFYLISDLIVLGLSLVYIPWQRIVYSLLTVVLSGQVIGFVQRVGRKKEEEAP